MFKEEGVEGGGVQVIIIDYTSLELENIWFMWLLFCIYRYLEVLESATRRKETKSRNLYRIIDFYFVRSKFKYKISRRRFGL